jgi:hypothetical protein
LLVNRFIQQLLFLGKSTTCESAATPKLRQIRYYSLNLSMPPRLLIFHPGDRITVRAKRPTHLMFLGGAALEGPRYIWWNFVSSRRERIEQAKEDWKTGKFAPVPGETEFIPLPDRFRKPR